MSDVKVDGRYGAIRVQQEAFGSARPWTQRAVARESAAAARSVALITERQSRIASQGRLREHHRGMIALPANYTKFGCSRLVAINEPLA